MNTAVILAAGLGSRLPKGLVSGPKGFIELYGQAIIKRSIQNLKNEGISKIIIGTGYLSEFYDALEDKQTIFCLKNHLFANTGSFYTLCNLSAHLTDDFLLLESDILYEKRALEILMGHKKNDVMLASGTTNAGDEVFIEVDKNNNLLNLSKNINSLANIYGELVGISKISIDTYKALSEWSKNNINKAKKIHYEEALAEIQDRKDIYIEKIDDLVWTEIDTKEHYNNAYYYIYPKIRKKENA